MARSAGNSKVNGPFICLGTWLEGWLGSGWGAGWGSGWGRYAMIVARVDEVPVKELDDLWKARMGSVASVHIYPLKGCRAIDLGESFVEPWGLAGDRRWLLVD